MRRRVVVTGLGAVTPVGNDVATTWQALLAGQSGAANNTRFDASKYSVRFACEVKQFDPLAYMDRKEAKRADAYAQFAIAAALQAAADAGISPGALAPESIGVIIGSGIGGIRSFEDQHDVYRTLGPSKISPFFIPMFIGDIAAGLVSMRLQAKGPNYATVSRARAHVIGDAFRIIQYGGCRS
jgi:3-oxoacyl-[acyl-carrier-protein] synthase II